MTFNIPTIKVNHEHTFNFAIPDVFKGKAKVNSDVIITPLKVLQIVASLLINVAMMITIAHILGVSFVTVLTLVVFINVITLAVA